MRVIKAWTNVLRCPAKTPQAARELASRRAKVEYVFRDIKIRFGYAKNRYRGLVKNAARLTFLTAIANVLRGDAYESRSLIASEI
ncbi:transposase [Methylomonas methanica]|uniref:transposase n=1 Tax=Methylomonas methanica TaxID=421 RepID=UPI001E3799D9|nr:transposase [Methylomonas methanica]